MPGWNKSVYRIWQDGELEEQHPAIRKSYVSEILSIRSGEHDGVFHRIDVGGIVVLISRGLMAPTFIVYIQKD